MRGRRSRLSDVRVFDEESSKTILLRECSRDDRFQNLVLLRGGVDAQLNNHLDLVTAIVARPEMTDFVLGRICRPLRCNQ